MNLLLTLVVALAAGLALTVFVTAVRVSRIRLRPMEMQAVDLPRVPAASRAILEVARRWLMPRGFAYVSSYRTRSMIAGKGDDWRYGDVYLDAARGVFAVAMPRELPQPDDPVAIELQSVYADGTVDLTVNRFRHTLVWEHPRWRVADSYEADMDKVLDAHVRRVAAQASPPLADPALRDSIARSILEEFVDRLVAAGRAARHGGEIRMTFAHAILYVWRLLAGNLRAGGVKPLPLGPAQAGAGGDAGVEADLQAYRGRRALSAATSSQGKWRLALLSAAGFVALGAVLWDAMFAVYVLVVIALHEGGHYYAMKWVGYRNLNVFFIPGLGGLATGEKQDATPAQKVFVYLAGPVPGIVLATAGLIAMSHGVLPDHAAVDSFLWVMLVVNALNLLPITPLDGGRVLEVLLFSRWPRLRLAFAAGSALVLLGGGLILGDTVMLVIGLLVTMALPAQWRFARLALSVQRGSREALDEPAAARRVFEALAQPRFRAWTFQKRATAADEMIAELRVALPRKRTMAAGLAIYASCFVVPMVAAVAASPAFLELARTLPETARMLHEINEEAARRGPRRDWEAELAAARGAPPEQYLALLVKAAQDEGAGPERRREMARLAGGLPQGHAVRAEALFVSMNIDEGDEATRAARRAQLEGLLGELRGDADDVTVLRGRVLSAVADTLPPGDERVTRLVDAREAMKGRVPPGHVELSTTWAAIAQERVRQGDRPAAEAEWKALLEWHGATPPADYAMLMGAEGARAGYARFLLEDDRLAEARALLEPAARRLGAEVAAGKALHGMVQEPHAQLLFWIAVAERDAAASREWLQAWRQAQGARADRNPTALLAQIAMADLAADTETARKAAERLAKMPAKKWMCVPEGFGEAPGKRLEAARRGALETYRVCA